MKCPTCPDKTLMMTQRQGIEIDYCPECRGVWLDRGELDKIIERSSQEFSNQNKAAQAIPQSPPPVPPPSGYYEDSYKYKYKRKKSLLEELFD